MIDSVEAALPVTKTNSDPDNRTIVLLGRTVRALVWRDLIRFFRQRSRVAGALLQPLIFWAVIGSGFQRSFRMPGAEQVGYMEFFFSGILALIILFTAIFTTMSIIDDRHGGFLQAVVVAPGSLPAIVLGKVLGGTLIALFQAGLFLLLVPLAGISYFTPHWPAVLFCLLCTAVTWSAFGFAIAWRIDSTQGYHAIMSVVLIPLWILSGAMFPVMQGPAWMQLFARLNPMAYEVSFLRRSLSARYPSAAFADYALIGLFAMAAILLAFWTTRRNRT